MHEVVVIIAGLALGAGAARLAAPRARAVVIAVGAIVIGTVWSRIVGEAEVLALWDIAQALAGAMAAVAFDRARSARGHRAAAAARPDRS